MNNQERGKIFELQMMDVLARRGYWVHFMTPDKRGAQPFDLIAVKDGQAYAIDCKTSAKDVFPYSRLEDNQIFAFELWRKRGNGEPLIAVKYQSDIYLILYDVLKVGKKVALTDDLLFARLEGKDE